MAKLDEIDVRILEAAYDGWFARGEEVTAEQILVRVAGVMQEPDKPFGIPDLDRRFDRLDHLGLLVDDGRRYLITPSGADVVERTGVAPPDLVERVDDARVRMLEALAKSYREHGRHASTHYSTLANDLALDRELAHAVIFHLDRAGLAEWIGTGGLVRISQYGLEEVAALAARRARVAEFEALSAMEPRPRGRELQKYLARLLDEEDWRAEEGATTDYEEMDVVLSRKREFYLFECKWEKDPAEAKYVRELKGKLDNRAGVRGVLVSMSRFTSGAAKQARDYANDREILLFGPGDVRNLVSGARSFEDLLDEKYRELTINKRVVVDGECVASSDGNSGGAEHC